MLDRTQLEIATRSVAWRDLCELSRRERWVGLAISAPWIVLAWILVAHDQPLLALPCWFVFFTAGMRQAHDGFHRNLGLSRCRTRAVLVGLSILMLIPLHAVRSSHHLHHADPLGDGDVEGYSARMRWWQAIVTGPVFTARLVRHGFGAKDANTALWTRIESLLVLAVVVAACAFDLTTLRYHVLAMALANCFTGFFAVWIVHRGCDRRGIYARTERGRWLGSVTFELLYHFEHHLFPRVPSCHLPELGRRLERVLPEVLRFRVLDRGAGPREVRLSPNDTPVHV